MRFSDWIGLTNDEMEVKQGPDVWLEIDAEILATTRL